MRKLVTDVFTLMALFPVTAFGGDDPVRPKSWVSPDMSDLWWIPGESGLGAELVQQGNLIFAISS